MNYLTGAARYEDGWLQELAIFCSDEPDEEMSRVGMIYEDYVEDVDVVIAMLKRGDTLVASFVHAGEGLVEATFPVEIVTVGGRQTLELVQMDQPAAYASLCALPVPGNAPGACG